MFRLVSTLVVFVFTGCASNIQVRYDAAADPDQSLGYLAGGFINSYRESFARMALEIHNVETGEAILVEFQQPKNAVSLELFPLSPGAYKISNVVEMGGIGDVGGRFPVSDANLSAPFSISRNSVTYIGHYDGKSTNDVTLFTMVGTVGWVTLDSGYAFEMNNKPVSEVRKLIEMQYPAFEAISILAAFDIASADQDGRR